MIMINNSYFVLVTTEESIGYITEDTTVSSLEWAMRFKERVDALMHWHRIRDNIFGEIKVAEILTITKVED